jgi:hypothetical protein
MVVGTGGHAGGVGVTGVERHAAAAHRSWPLVVLTGVIWLV